MYNYYPLLPFAPLVDVVGMISIVDTPLLSCFFCLRCVTEVVAASPCTLFYTTPSLFFYDFQSLRDETTNITPRSDLILMKYTVFLTLKQLFETIMANWPVVNF